MLLMQSIQEFLEDLIHLEASLQRKEINVKQIVTMNFTDEKIKHNIENNFSLQILFLHLRVISYCVTK